MSLTRQSDTAVQSLLCLVSVSINSLASSGKSGKNESGEYVKLNQLIRVFDLSAVEHDDINVYAEILRK